MSRFRELLDASERIVGFTGAGISTESGIPDYRSKGGIWDRYQPVYYDEFVRSEEKRRLYWRRRLEMWPSIRDATPNEGHRFFVDLYRDGRLLGVITQNIDGLHEKSGLPDDIVVNLHGTALEVRCLECGYTQPSEEVSHTIDLDHGTPRCPKCNGLVKPATISFGQSLDRRMLERSNELAESCDLLIVMGSTLIVYPAAGIPAVAKQHGAALAIISRSGTPYDDEADFRSHEGIGQLVRKLRNEL